MKVNYLSKNRSRQSYSKLLLVLMMVFISGVILFSLFGSTIINVLSPIWRAENVVMRNLRSLTTYFLTQQSLVKENTFLKEKVSSLETEISSLNKKQNQIENLLTLLGQRQETSMITGAVLTHPPQTPYDIVIIDAGSNDSVTLGSKVFLPEGPILGTVSEVTSKWSKVKLFSAVGTETNAILERNNVPVVLVGLGAGNFKLILPRDVAIEKGDRLLSPDLARHLLAVVDSVSTRSTDSFKDILVKSPVNMFTFQFVFITP